MNAVLGAAAPVFVGGPTGGTSVTPGAPPVHEIALDSASWTETAHEWLHRSNRRRAERGSGGSGAPPRDPSEAAWRFFRPEWGTPSGGGSVCVGGTGVAFVDAALRLSYSDWDDRLPVLDLRGDASSGKTWTLLTLAARFAAATRPSLFLKSGATAATSNPASRVDALPQVIVLDSTYDVTTSRLAYVVRSTLLLSSPSATPDHFQRDMECCLGRIHVANAHDVLDWIPILESLRIQLLENHAEHPTLILWDGFLGEDDAQRREAPRMDVIRQLDRLLRDCPACLVSTSPPAGARRYEWERRISHRIRLERVIEPTPTLSDHLDRPPPIPMPGSVAYAATVRGSRIPYSISLAGILS